MIEDGLNQNKKYIYFYLIIYFIFILNIIYNFSLGYDIYWHIRVGEWIVQNFSVPHSGILTYTQTTTPWTSHEWLSEIIIYFVYYIGGWHGLLVCTLIFSIAALAIVNIHISKYTTPIRCMIFITLSFIMLTPHIMPRPHILALPVLAIWASSLIRFSENNKPPPLTYLLLIVIWANLHGSFIVGLGLIVFFAAESVIYERSKALRILYLKKWSVFFTLAVLCSLMTPHGFEGLIFPLNITNQEYALNFIAEWKSPDFHKFQGLELWLILFLFISLANGLKLPLTRIIFILLLIHLSLKHIRYVPDLMAVLTPLILASPIQMLFSNAPMEARRHDYKRILIDKKLVLFSSVLFLFVLASITQVTLPDKKGKELADVLVTIKPYISNSDRIFNSYGMGGKLIFYGFLPFIDGRADMYGDDYLKQHQNAINLRFPDSFTKLEEKYGLSWAFLSSSAPLNVYLEILPEWLCLYSDNRVKVYFNKSKVSNIEKLRKELEKLPDNKCFG